MKPEKLLRFEGSTGASGLFYACGSFGIINKACKYEKYENENKTVYRYENQQIALTASFECKDNGVIIRKDFFENLTDTFLQINVLHSRFCLDGNSYEVYTQYNAWQHESSGCWQKLNTCVTAASTGIRTCDGAAPIMGFHNLHSGQNTVFHLLPNAKWQMTAKKFPESQKEIVLFECGFNDENMCLTVNPKEKIELPTVIFYNAKSKTDLDAYKLHQVYNTLYPREKMPVLYNSWLYCFDNLDIDALLKQADCAKEMGIEAFMVDAGWFGNGENWSVSVGDWEENLTGGPRGRLKELSDKVREKGMIFGLWFEPERANPQSNAVKSHPEYYIDNYFLNFANDNAVDYIINVISEKIEQYNIGYLKFDFNDTTPLDSTGDAFYRYMQGQKRFIETLKQKYPHVYITNCASGGYRMELMQGSITDSFWLSDNQGPIEGIRIVKDTLKRMPTALIERWNVQKYADGFPRHGEKESVGVMFSCNNATWDNIVTVEDSFTKAFINAGPIGFSCDIEGFPQKYKELYTEHIKEFKENRDFFINATARILIDTDDIIAIEYANYDLSRIIIQLFTKNTYSDDIILYPIVNDSFNYILENKSVKGTELSEDGIQFKKLKNYSGCTVDLRRI